jgi:hypothetical protein
MRPNIWAVKDAARIEDVARDYGEFRAVGAGRLLNRCLDPRHEDRTASMTVYVEEQRFKCYGCGERGDVIDLVRLAEGCETWEAMLILSTRYGVELPGRPDSWYRRQERQKPVRDCIREARVEHVRLLVFRLIWVPWLKRVPEDVREEAEAGAWKDSLWMANRLYANRMGVRREEG